MISTDVRAARRGDREAFGRLVREHAGAVCAVTTAILGPDGADEAAQEAFVAAWQGLRTLDDPERFGAWVRGIARNRAREALRRKARSREVLPGDALSRVADGAPDPGEQLDGARAEAAMWSALDALEEDQREVLVLFYREGGSVEAVARQLELAEPAVRKRLSRAREKLRDGVEERLGQRLTRTAPKAAAVAAAVVALLPGRSAWAVGIGVGAVGLGVVAALAVGRVDRDLPEIVAPPAREVARFIPTSAGVEAEPGVDPVPRRVVQAFLAAEDARFYDHGAVDYGSMARAAVHDVAGEGELQGGSTLTQQLAKRMLGDRPRGVGRKVGEVLLAVDLERSLTKDQILASYLDGVYLGAGASGVEEAARVYFDEAPSALSLGQAALLAGIPANPQGYGPFTDPDGARARRTEVLDRMTRHGWATADEVAEAEAEPLPVKR